MVNGWSNYSTWCVNLWLSNDEALYKMVKASIQELTGDRDNKVSSLAGIIKNQVVDNSPLIDTASMYSDMLNEAMSQVNYTELATSWLDGE